jgi:leucyl aminopeptidase (aminopeptidase T)
MISATAEVFEDTLTATPAQLSAINSGLLEALMPGRTLRIKTEGGTDMTLKLDPSLRWISNRGRARAGGMIVLPAGEVATCPAEAEGIFVADFAFNVNTEVNLDVRLDHTPVTVRLKDGHADSV